MASPVGHTLVGVGVASVVAQVAGASISGESCLGAIAASNLPDLDWLGTLFGPPSRRVHRHASHSLAVLIALIALVGALETVLGIGWGPGLGAAWAAALLSHPILDVVTTSPGVAARGFGIPLLWPVSARRWAPRKPVFPTPEFRPYRSVAEYWKALLPEIYALAPPCVALILFCLSR